MKLDKLRYELTEHREKVMFTYDNFKLLIHPDMDNDELFERLDDDLDLMPEIPRTIDGVDIRYYRYDYNEEIFYKSELLSFILAAINKDWDIVKGFDINTGRLHYFLKYNDEIYDPSLAVMTKYDLYSKRFKTIKVIKNEEVEEYLKENNNLYRFYHKGLFNKKDKDFSINFINNIKRKFNENFCRQYELSDEKIEEIKDFFWHDNFIDFRQVLTCRRKSSLVKNKISIHPSVDKKVLDEIDKYADSIRDLMKDEYDIIVDYYNGTIGNCYALSIMFNLFNGEFKLIQGGIPYKSRQKDGDYYQHSWLEYKDVVYDPALRVVTPKDLYYMFVEKHNEYTKEETENILRRIGLNLTHFRDFLNGVQVGGDETIRYRSLVNKIDSDEFREEGEKLLSLVKLYR